MSDLSPETNELLALARSAEGLTDARRAQIKAGLLAQVAVISVIGVTSATAGAGATAVANAGAAAGTGAVAGAGKLAWLSSSFAKAVSAIALLSATGAGVYLATRPERAPEPPRVQAPTLAKPASASTPAAPAPAAPAPAAPAVEATLEAAPNAPPAPAPNDAPSSKPSSASPRAVATATTVTAETLAEETRLLRDADQALRAGNAQRALALLDQHASRYPHGALAPERNAERLIARCKLGQIDAKAARAYLGSHPNSAFAPRIRDACGVD